MRRAVQGLTLSVAADSRGMSLGRGMRLFSLTTAAVHHVPVPRHQHTIHRLLAAHLNPGMKRLQAEMLSMLCYMVAVEMAIFLVSKSYFICMLMHHVPTLLIN